MRAILFVLLVGWVSACGSSTSSTKASSSAQKGDKAKAKPGKLKKKRPPFEPPPLASLPDLGELRTAKLSSVGTSLKKLCPAPKRGKAAAGGCACLPVGETTGSEVWSDNVASCSSPVEGLKPPLENLQLLASQESPRQKRGEAPSMRASFRLLFQTRKGWFASELGAAESAGGAGYSRTLKFVSMDFVTFASSEAPGVLATFEDRGAAEEGSESPAARGLVVACVAVDAKKIGCTEPLALGEARAKGGYQLNAVVEEGSLYLAETGEKTPDELKSRSGKYAVVAP